MITVLSGAVNSGKTSLLMQEVEKQPRCGGFLSPKVFREDLCIGYDLHILRSGKRIPFIRRKAFCDSREVLEEQLGDFGFYHSGFEAARKELKALRLEDPDLPVYVDELGPIELNDGGYLHEVCDIFALSCNITLCMRSKIRPDMIYKLGLCKYKLKEIGENSLSEGLVYV